MSDDGSATPEKEKTDWAYLIASISYHYGLTDAEILGMPARRFFGVYVNNLPRLQAEEMLRMIQATSVSWMEESEGRRLIRDLQKQARGGRPAQQRIAPPQDETPEDKEARKRLKHFRLQQQFGAGVVKMKESE